MKTKEAIPTYALPYLIYGDATNLDNKDIQVIEDWCNTNYVTDVIPIYNNEENLKAYFSNFPTFGKATEVTDCIVICKKYPKQKIINRLIKKVTSINTPNNTSFTYYNLFKVSLESNSNDFFTMSLYTKEINLHIISVSFDYLTKKLVISYCRNSLLQAAIVNAFKQLYKNINIVYDDTF